jgi:cytochrome P450
MMRTDADIGYREVTVSRLGELARSRGPEAEAYIEATVYEGMCVRPVIPMVFRRVNRPWRLGDYVVPSNTPQGVSIVALHHREDVYPDPHVFRPERFLGRGLGTYTWVPFGGGTRRCLGATLALAEQRVVLCAVARRTRLHALRPAPEGARQPKRDHDPAPRRPRPRARQVRRLAV